MKASILIPMGVTYQLHILIPARCEIISGATRPPILLITRALGGTVVAGQTIGCKLFMYITFTKDIQKMNPS